MRVAVDLQPMQSEGSRNRGIGRYVQSLLEHLFPLARRARYELYGNARLPAPEFSTQHGLPMRTIGYEAPGVTGVNEVLLKTVFLHDRPEVLFLPSPLEMSDPVMPSYADFPLPVYAVCYDLVPLLFPERYLADRSLRNLYHKRLQNLRHADYLFAISESARQDAIRLLDVAPEKIINVSAGVSPFFAPTPGDMQAHWQKVLAQKFGITRPFVLCTGGEDWRKNLEGLVDGFARLPSILRKDHQLVIACRMSGDGGRKLKQRAEERGMAPGALVITGFVSDDELRALYGLCRLFVFPSLYEGFGLPLAEALACGAPVVTGDNSSLVEIVPSPDQLFDARSVKSIGDRLEAVLSDPALLGRLRGEAAHQASRFTWQAVAEKVNAVFEQATPPKIRETFVFRRANEAAETQEANETEGRRLAFWSPRSLPTGISDYTAEMVPALARYFPLDLIVDDNHEPVTQTGEPHRHRVINHNHWAETAEEQGRDYLAALYPMGNHPFHGYEYAALLRYAGITILHDYDLSGLISHMAAHQPEWAVMLGDELTHQYGPERACQITDDLAGGKYDVDSLSAQNICLNRRIFSRSLGVVLQDKVAFEKAKKEYGNVCAHITYIPPIIPPVVMHHSPDEVRLLREKWNVPASAFVFAAHNAASNPKSFLRLLDAFANHRAAHPTAFLLFVGTSSLPPDLSFETETTKRGLQNHVKITGAVGTALFEECLRASDVCVFPSHSQGEAESALLRTALALNKPSIVGANAFPDVPDRAVHSLSSHDEAGAEAELVRAFHVLQSDASARQALVNEGAAFIQEHSPERVAQKLAAFIQTVMNDPLTRSKLLADYVGREVARAAVTNGLENPDQRLLAPFEAVLAIPAGERTTSPAVPFVALERVPVHG